MKFWKGNRIDAEFELPVTEVADQFISWWHEQPAEYREQIPLERALRFWLSAASGLNASWVDETGPGSFEELFERVYERAFPPREAS